MVTEDDPLCRSLQLPKAVRLLLNQVNFKTSVVLSTSLAPFYLTKKVLCNFNKGM